MVMDGEIEAVAKGTHAWLFIGSSSGDSAVCNLCCEPEQCLAGSMSAGSCAACLWAGIYARDMVVH